LIEFVDRERRPVFAFELKTDRIIRSSHEAFGVKTEDFGGYPSDGLANGAKPTFVFTKRRFGMAVSIGSNRYPWYDYPIADSLLVTHVAVSSGLTNAEVTLERKECTQECHPDECRDGEGRSVCQGANCTGNFAVVMGSENGVAASCTSSRSTTPGSSMHCCDGSAVTPAPRTTLAKDTWVSISNDGPYLRRMCNAFSISEADCREDWAGQVARIDNTSLGNGNWRVFIPSLLNRPTETGDHSFPDSGDDSCFRELPFLAFFEYFLTNNVMVTRPLAQTTSTERFEVDRFHGIITTSDPAYIDPELSKGRYIDLVQFTVNTARSPWGTKLIRFNRWGGFVAPSSDDISIFASDIPVDGGDCTDEPFVDALGNTCADYTSNAWCFRSGYPTAAGTAAIAREDGRLPQGFNASEEPRHDFGPFDGANIQCCACGGGANTPPPGFTMPGANRKITM